MSVDADGKIVVAGTSHNGGNDNFALVRYNADGSLDTTFDADGQIVTAVGSFGVAASVDVQADGKIVVAGTSSNGNTSRMVLVRYNADGSLDVEFGKDGVSAEVLGDYSLGYAATIQGDGKIVVAGFIQKGNKRGFGVARFEADNPNVAPIADAGGPYSVSEGDPLVLDASASYDPDGTIASYTWDINGDSVYGDATGLMPTLNWAQLQALGIGAGPATYQVRVQVTDSGGETTTSDPTMLTVVNTAPRLGPAAVTMWGFASLHPPYTVPTGNGEQLRTVPVANVDTIAITFPEDVIVTLGDLAMSGVNFGAYTFTGFSYNPLTFTATWTLPSPIGADKLTLTLSDNVTDLFGAALDGEWDNPTDLNDPSSSTLAGDGIEGGDFVFQFTVLPGDANRDNQVTGADYSLWADNYGTPNATFEQGDFTGDGRLTPADYTIWADNFGLDLTGVANTPARSERSHGIAALVPIDALLQSPRDVEVQAVPLLAPRSTVIATPRAMELTSETRRAAAQTEQSLPAARLKPDAAQAHDAALLGWWLDSLGR